MKIGDLVNVVQEIGCHTPPKLRPRGQGIVLDIVNTTPYHLRDIGFFNLGRTITVHLMNGTMEEFCERSVEVISESR